jgi:hypothetical protein
MKLRFHKNDVFAYAHILVMLALQDNVTLIDATEYIFFYYGTFLDKHWYNNFKTGTIQKNHIFKSDEVEGEALAMKSNTHDGVDDVLQIMLRGALYDHQSDANHWPVCVLWSL